MADVNANIDVNIDTSSALSQLKSLQRQISQFHTSIAKSSEMAALAQRDLQKNLLSGINATGAFSAELRTIKTSAEAFTNSLEKNKFSMREYFRYAGASTKTFGKLFKSEFDTINKVAEDNVKRLQTQYIKLGRDSSGAMKAIAVMPNQLDLSNYSTQVQMAAQKQALFNQLMKQGSTNLLNFGKNTQWAGRQLMVGFSIPLLAVGSTATKTFMEMEAQALKFKKVYGDLFTPKEETAQALADIQTLGQSFTKYGIAVSKTVGLAADAAAAGFQGIDLQRQTTEATRLSVLGQIDGNQALETTIALQNAFQMSSDNLAGSINFLNAVENQTVLSLDDITTAIPKVAPVIQQLGGDVKDLAFFMTAMKEGGINASEGANALKSGLGALINPTAKASAMLSGYGINIKKIVEGNQGDIKSTVIQFAQALDTLAPLDRAKAIEQLFGKFQFARLSTLFSNVTKDGTQASRVLQLAGTSLEDLAALSEQELGVTADSAMNKFKKTVEDLKVSLIPIGKAFLEAVTPILEFVSKVLEKFSGLSDGTKKAITLMTVAIGGLGPVLLMTFGLLANGVANIIKLFMTLRQGYLRLTGQSQILGEQTQYLTVEQQNAAAVAHSLDQSHAKLIQTFTSENAAVTALAAAYQSATRAASAFAMSNPGAMLPKPKGFASGGIIKGPGSGTSDSILAMVSNGEAIIPAEIVKKFPELVNGLVAGNIPGFKNGLKVAGVAGPEGSQFGHITTTIETTVASFLGSLKSMSEDMQQQHKSTIHYLQQLADLGLGAKKLTTYSGLGVWQSEATNEALGKGTRQVPKEMILQDIQSQGIKRWEPALAIGKAKLEDVADELTQYDIQLQDSIRNFENLNGNTTISGQELEKLEAELRQTLPATSQLRQALDLAADTITEFRISLSQSDLRDVEKNFPGAIVPKVAGQASSAGINITGVSGKTRKVRAKGDNLKARVPGGMGSYSAIAMSTAEEVANDVIAATARGAGTNSPSKKTIPIGEDIARGLEVGMANRQDDVAKSGADLSNAAVGGTQKTRRVATREQGAPTPINVPSLQTDTSEETKKTKMSLGQMNNAIMGASFALTSLAGVGSMFGGTIGDVSGKISQFSGVLFGLMSVTQLLTQAKVLELAATRAKTVADLMGSKTVGGLFSKGGGLAGFGKNLLTAGKFALRFAGPIGIATTAMLGTIAVIKMVNAARERERLAIEGLADAMTTTTSQVKTLGDFFGVVPSKLPFDTGQREIVAAPVRSQRETLKADPAFQKEFKSTIESLRKASNEEAKIVFSSLALNLKAQGFASEQIQVIVDSLREESSQTDVKLDVKSLSLSKESLDQLKKDIVPLLLNLNKALKTGSTEKSAIQYGTDKIIRWIELSKDAQKELETMSTFISETGKSAAGMFELGLIDGVTYQATLTTVLETTSGLDTANRKLLLTKVFSKMGTDAKALVGILGDAKKEMMMLALVSAGAIPQSVLDDLAATGKDAAFRQARGAYGLNQAYEKLLATVKEVNKEQGKGGGGGGGGGTGEIPLAQKAIDSINEKSQALLDQAKTYSILRAKGYDAATAADLAADSLVAAAVASGKIKVGAKYWDDFVKAVKKAKTAAQTGSATSGLSELDQQEQSTQRQIKALKTLVANGIDSKKALELVNNANFVQLINNTKDAGTSLSDVLELIKKIQSGLTELENIGNPFSALKKNAEDLTQQFQDQYDAMMESFRIQEQQARNKFQPGIDIAQGEVDRIQKEIEDINNAIDGLQQNISDKQRKIEIEIDRPIAVLQSVIEDLQKQMEDQIDKPIAELQKSIEGKQRNIELNFDRPIAAFQSAIEDLQKQMEDQIDKPITQLQNSIDQMQRNIELQFDRPLKTLSDESKVLSHDLELIGKQEDSINEKFDKQRAALEEINKLNQESIALNKTKLGLADALSQGDISAAAAAIQDMRAQEASANATAQQTALDQARTNALGQITINGKTRAQIEERQWQISQQSYKLEQARALVEAQILNIQDQIYIIEQARPAIQAQIDAINAQILIKETQRKVILAEIQSIEDKIYGIEQGRVLIQTKIDAANAQILIKEAARKVLLDEIQKIEDTIYAKQNLGNDSLRAKNLELENAKTKLDEEKKKLDDALKTINDQKTAWDNQKLAIDAAKSAADILNISLEETLRLVEAIVLAWAGVGAADKAAADAAAKAKAAADKALADAKAAADKAAADAANGPSFIDETATTQAEIDALIKAREGMPISGPYDPRVIYGGQRIDSSGNYISYNPEMAAAMSGRTVVTPDPVKVPPRISTGNRGFLDPLTLSSGGIVPKYFDVGGFARGTDTVPAMLTPGEFIMSKYAVQSHGIDKMKAMNNGSSAGDSVYNYSVSVNVDGTNANPQDIARYVIKEIKGLEAQKIKGYSK